MSQDNIALIPKITKSSYVTLHYRLSSVDCINIVTTFHSSPATLQCGAGQLAPFLEACLIGLAEGEEQTFELAPEMAFGMRNPELIKWVSRATLEQNSKPDEEYKVGDLVNFNAPNGGSFVGMLSEINAEKMLFDFNHPLAGKSLKFEVKIIGVLHE